ncbi:LysR substrate-binding domain-containing protein [Ascidiaceihabitans sp.]|uniref:LysR substrate-binding domain-containing protein n=1 Tax=Ascidiaceihabitans sp. TaxID=1872644 RepID=UPI003297D0A3
MKISRRNIPSTAALMCLDAVAQHGSATAAAQVLALTQSAVSRQLKSLEQQLRVTLVEKDGRGLRLTAVGQRYAHSVHSILSDLNEATLTARDTPQAHTLELAILPGFGMHWLAPRLSDFAAKHPEITLNLATRFAPFDFRAARFDAAIHFGREDWTSAQHMALMAETVVPVCAPDVVDSDLLSPTELLRHPLLHLDTRSKGWMRWFQARGVNDTLPTGMVFDQFSTMAQAAIHGAGIALLPDFVAEPHLKSGQLKLAASGTSQSIGAYFLVWPPERNDFAPLDAFRTWLAAQTSPE